jgi:hypothetical protein
VVLRQWCATSNMLIYHALLLSLVDNTHMQILCVSCFAFGNAGLLAVCVTAHSVHVVTVLLGDDLI